MGMDLSASDQDFAYFDGQVRIGGRSRSWSGQKGVSTLPIEMPVQRANRAKSTERRRLGGKTNGRAEQEDEATTTDEESRTEGGDSDSESGMDAPGGRRSGASGADSAAR